MNFDIKRAGRALALVFCCGLLLACGAEEVEQPVPPPVAVTRDDTGHLCGMIVEDHTGPKSQIILQGQDKPLWFTTARDGIAFTLLPEETRPIAVFYVSAVDLGGWDHPESDPANLVRADTAWFVIDSDRRGSMGAAETIPFQQRKAAEVFIQEHGGKIMRLSEIPGSYVLGPGGM